MITTTYYRIQSYSPEALLETEISSLNYGTLTEKAGVSACGSYEDLVSYIAITGLCVGEPGAMLIEMEGTEADEADDDAEMGALLVHPTRIISATPVEDTDIFTDIDALLGDI